MRPATSHEREVRIARGPLGAVTAYGEPTDTRLAAIHEALDRMTDANLHNLTARMALLDIADELRDRAPRGRTRRAD
jgi:hypothetical protein